MLSGKERDILDTLRPALPETQGIVRILATTLAAKDTQFQQEMAPYLFKAGLGTGELSGMVGAYAARFTEQGKAVPPYAQLKEQFRAYVVENTQKP